MIFKLIKKRAMGWRPLVLHWRRRRSVRPSISKVNRVSSSVSISYFPQVHLHFTTHVSNHSVQRSAVEKNFFANTTIRERVLLERRFEKRIYADKEPRSPREHRHRSSPLTYKNNTATPRLGLETTRYRFLALAPYGPRAPIPTQIQQPPASAAFKIRSQLLLHTRVAELNNVLKTQLHFREHEHRSQLLSFRSAQHETLLETHRVAELVWRDVPQTRNQQPVALTPAVSSTHAQSASSSTQSTPQQQITKLDPALVDRLTDDVIRRVEKRARIERQRRGL